MRTAIFAALLTLAGSSLLAQVNPERERAKPHVARAWTFMREESWADAAKAFQQAIEIDREHEGAYYGLGLSSIRLKKYSDAIAAYLKCRDLYSAQAGKQFSNRQDAQRYRQDRLTEIDEVIRQYQSGPQTAGSQDRLRQLQQQRRDIQEYINRGSNMTVENSVPAFVSLALGSAYFRTEQWAEAEREYKAAIASDPKSGEAFNNLAVVYLQTGRIKEAEESVKAAERAGYKVHPQLKQEIKTKAG
jgi:tetratricopeptide (TPR) repeat protein